MAKKTTIKVPHFLRSDGRHENLRLVRAILEDAKARRMKMSIEEDRVAIEPNVQNRLRPILPGQAGRVIGYLPADRTDQRLKVELRSIPPVI